MKTWLRWTLVVTQIGGGFLGIVTTLVYMIGYENMPFMLLVISLVFIGLYTLVTVSGVLLAIDERHTKLISIVIGLQTPIISSPIIAWMFCAGFSVNLTWIGAELGFNLWLGSQWQVNVFQELPWGFGINIFAVLMLILLRGFRKKQVILTTPVNGQINPILQAKLANISLGDRGIQLRISPEGAVRTMIGSQEYNSDEVPNADVKLHIKSAIEELHNISTPEVPSSPEHIDLV
jgi:hypothetical protein